MRNQQAFVNELFQLTEEIIQQVKAIQTSKNQNDIEQVENVQLLFDQRQEIIQQVDIYMKQQQEFKWTKEEQLKIRELKTLEQTLQPLMTHHFESLLKQMDRIHQTKQVSKKYFAAYQTVSTDGSFIDKRK